MKAAIVQYQLWFTQLGKVTDLHFQNVRFLRTSFNQANLYNRDVTFLSFPARALLSAKSKSHFLNRKLYNPKWIVKFKFLVHLRGFPWVVHLPHLSHRLSHLVYSHFDSRVITLPSGLQTDYSHAINYIQTEILQFIDFFSYYTGVNFRSEIGFRATWNCRYNSFFCHFFAPGAPSWNQASVRGFIIDFRLKLSVFRIVKIQI